MFRLKLTVQGNQAAQAELERRLRIAGSVAAANAAVHITDIVRSQIPSGGWYDIYKKAITYFASADGMKYAVSGHWETQFSTFPADTTLVTFTGTSDIASVLVQFNPWVIDQLPAISGGYRVAATAKPQSVSDVEARRKVLVGVATPIRDKLKAAGATIVDGFPVVNGRVYADIAFMARALEHGLAGLKRIPHWLVAYNIATRSRKNSIRVWTEEVRGKIQAILDGNGNFVSDAPALPPDLARALERQGGG